MIHYKVTIKTNLLADQAHVAGWEPSNVHDLLLYTVAHVPWVGSVLYRPCAVPQGGRLGSI